MQAHLRIFKVFEKCFLKPKESMGSVMKILYLKHIKPDMFAIAKETGKLYEHLPFLVSAASPISEKSISATL